MEMLSQKNHQKNKIPDQGATIKEIILYADPLCCWTFAFLPELKKIKDMLPGIPIRLCMGGLIPGWTNYHDRMNEISRPAQMGPLWMQASQLTGIEYNSAIWSADPPASSYPAGMAVKCAGLQHSDFAELYLELAAKAVMQQGRNIARPEELRKLADQLEILEPGFDAIQFQDDMTNGKGLESFKQDISETRSKQISRFPSLLIRRSDEKSLLISGYKTIEEINEIIYHRSI